MAPADVARASTSTDSIKGLAQSIAKPAYRRLLVGEAALRRAVPILIITFLMTMAIGTGTQVYDRHREALVAIAAQHRDGGRLDRLPPRSSNHRSRRIARQAREVVLRAIARYGARDCTCLRWQGRCDRRRAGAIRDSGMLSSTCSAPTSRSRRLALAPEQWRCRCPTAPPRWSRSDNLQAPLGQLAIVAAKSPALISWRADAALTATLSATTGSWC